MGDSVDDPRDMYQHHDDEEPESPLFMFAGSRHRPTVLPTPFNYLLQQLAAGQYAGSPPPPPAERGTRQDQHQEPSGRSRVAMTFAIRPGEDGGTWTSHHFGSDEHQGGAERQEGEENAGGGGQNFRRGRPAALTLANFLGQAFGSRPDSQPESPSEGERGEREATPLPRHEGDNDPLAQSIFRLLAGVGDGGGGGGIQFFFGPEFGGSNQPGDYVFTQQGMDNIITQLMEQVLLSFFKGILFRLVLTGVLGGRPLWATTGTTRSHRSATANQAR
jgi:hypothetical protein